MRPDNPVARAWEAFNRRYPTAAMRDEKRERERLEAELERDKRYEDRGGVSWTP